MTATIKKLNNLDHATLTVIDRYGQEWGDSRMSCLAYTVEMRQLQSTYPLLFQMTPEAAHPLPIALMGFEPAENLFLDGAGWGSDVIPMMMRKGPFLIAQENDPTGGAQSVIAIDESHPKVASDGGQALFLEYGGHSDYLEQMIQLLERIESTHQHTLAFALTLNELGLVSPLEFAITLNNGDTHSLQGFFGVDEERLAALSSEDLGTLHEQGFLTPLFMMVASQSQMARLIGIKNKRLG